MSILDLWTWADRMVMVHSPSTEQAEWCNMWCGWGGFCRDATLACAYAAVPA